MKIDLFTVGVILATGAVVYAIPGTLIAAAVIIGRHRRAQVRGNQ